MDLEETTTEEPRLQVSFQPHLFLQRRGWVLDQLRRERVTSVLDVGCGQGELLSCLCQPAPWLPPPTVPLSNGINIYTDPTAPSSKQKAYYPLPNSLPDKIINLHPAYIAGLDVSRADLQYAIEDTRPVPEKDWNAACRWEPLQVKLWNGGLETVNTEFTGFECIVATEVIEHLREDVLPEFAPVLLGVYHPRLLLITTPSYTFNARFSAPDGSIKRVGGYPDPTGRTSRVFRHDDHKFEWTVEEFEQWCGSVAEEWGYTVETSGVGRAVEEDEWGRDEELGYASQVAKFIRIEGDSWKTKRSQKSKDIMKKGKERPKHELLAMHQYLPHPKACHPVSLREIGEAVRSKMQDTSQAEIIIELLWFDLNNDIASMCGGWFEYLVEAIKEHEALELRGGNDTVRSEWRVELIGAVEQKQESWWEGDETEAEDVPEDPEYEHEDGITDGNEVSQGEDHEWDEGGWGNSWSIEDTDKSHPWPSGWGSEQDDDNGSYAANGWST